MNAQLERFKQFARQHPKLVNEVRSHRRTWQEIYEEWVIFGEDDDIWEPYLSDNSKKHIPNTAPDVGKQHSPMQMLSILKNIDIDALLTYAAQINEALSMVSQLLGNEDTEEDDRPLQDEQAPTDQNNLPNPSRDGPPSARQIRPPY